MSGTPLAVRTRPELHALRATSWMSASEAALYLGARSAQTLVEWRRIAVGPDWRREGKYILYRRADLDLFLARGGVPSAAFPARELILTPEEIDGKEAA